MTAGPVDKPSRDVPTDAPRFDPKTDAPPPAAGTADTQPPAGGHRPPRGTPRQGAHPRGTEPGTDTRIPVLNFANSQPNRNFHPTKIKFTSTFDWDTKTAGIQNSEEDIQKGLQSLIAGGLQVFETSGRKNGDGFLVIDPKTKQQTFIRDDITGARTTALETLENTYAAKDGGAAPFNVKRFDEGADYKAHLDQLKKDGYKITPRQFGYNDGYEASQTKDGVTQTEVGYDTSFVNSSKTVKPGKGADRYKDATEFEAAHTDLKFSREYKDADDIAGQDWFKQKNYAGSTNAEKFNTYLNDPNGHGPIVGIGPSPDGKGMTYYIDNGNKTYDRINVPGQRTTISPRDVSASTVNKDYTVHADTDGTLKFFDKDDKNPVTSIKIDNKDVAASSLYEVEGSNGKLYASADGKIVVGKDAVAAAPTDDKKTSGTDDKKTDGTDKDKPAAGKPLPPELKDYKPDVDADKLPYMIYAFGDKTYKLGFDGTFNEYTVPSSMRTKDSDGTTIYIDDAKKTYAIGPAKIDVDKLPISTDHAMHNKQDGTYQIDENRDMKFTITKTTVTRDGKEYAVAPSKDGTLKLYPTGESV